MEFDVFKNILGTPDRCMLALSDELVYPLPSLPQMHIAAATVGALPRSLSSDVAAMSPLDPQARTLG
jgi:hypothetical protein